MPPGLEVMMKPPSKEALDAANEKRALEWLTSLSGQTWGLATIQRLGALLDEAEARGAGRSAEQVRAGIVAMILREAAVFKSRCSVHRWAQFFVNAIERHEDERHCTRHVPGDPRCDVTPQTTEDERPVESPAKCKRCGGAGSFIDGPFEDDLNNWVNCPECGGVGRSGKGAG